MKGLNIDLRAIRPLNGSQAKGFEELCAQIAKTESPVGSHFRRKGTPDAGVECYSVLYDNSEWGWQSKYFELLGDSQWKQLDKSVKTALDSHSQMIRYFICIPLDRPDGRIAGKQSAMEAWDKHVLKWTGWAQAKGMTVEFVYWGLSEIIDFLSQPVHVGRVRFWFDSSVFDTTWFNARLDEALKTAGPRYTPELNLDLPIREHFEGFGRTEAFFNSIKTLAKSIREKHRGLRSLNTIVDQVIQTANANLTLLVQEILTRLGDIKVQPIDELPLGKINKLLFKAEATVRSLELELLQREADYEKQPLESEGLHNNPYRDPYSRITELSGVLKEVGATIGQAQQTAESSLMILTGKAGTGKTHLLCDVAKERISAGKPTILLMGQRFINTNEPWGQALQQMDLADTRIEEFVGALEAAAQVADCRALFIIDALNEGAGSSIWPNTLVPFLAHLERSPWISVVLTVRSSYEDSILPESVRDRAYRVVHEGFSGLEYKAVKNFFIHYGLELPSTPMLALEFQNPLFLKVLCKGLRSTEQVRLPRGLHGITATFDLYLSGINQRLALNLNYHPEINLVKQALEVFVKATIEKDQRWLPLREALATVNNLLPSKEYKQSLYYGLISEGVLVEEVQSQPQGVSREKVVFIAYERLADHLVAERLLNVYLDAANPSVAFREGGPLAFLWELSGSQQGLIEAMFIQVPERTNQELSELAPQLINSWNADAFYQSLIWRSLKSFSPNTGKVLNEFLAERSDNRALDVILTIATLPGHPFDAKFLDRRLRKDNMPERDAWWSVRLHKLWKTRSVLNRLIDWSSEVIPATGVDEETIDLCAITLAWTFTSSNRSLRDRATKGLVNLLTGRLDAVERLVKRFADVDDPYVAERVYAVAYGTATRSYDPVAVGELASSVYTCVFANGSPPAHILLRDYARGVIERAIYLKAELHIEVERIRPPYSSQWPHIPTRETIAPLLPNWSTGSYDSGQATWSRNRIGHSVMEDDFAHYVMKGDISNWLSLPLNEPEWVRPKQYRDLLKEFVRDLSVSERVAWEAFQKVESQLQFRVDEFYDESTGNDILSLTLVEDNAYQDALAILYIHLTPQHAQQFAEIKDRPEPTDESTRAPTFDLGIIQRYVLWRVFDLGWTIDRFGAFDRFNIGYHGRDASKAERIGKKYQWIAYHEIMALVADHFQFREHFSLEETVQPYEGPWQTSLRDIDPSSTSSFTPGGTSWCGHSPAWWAPTKYENWGKSIAPEAWLKQWNDLPKIETLLLASGPNNNCRWVNVAGTFDWVQPVPADLESSEVEKKEIWYICTGYFVQEKDRESFMHWAETTDFMGDWMPRAPTNREMFFGEHSWSPASRQFEREYSEDFPWIYPGRDCPVQIQPIAFGYTRDSGSFDCSIDNAFTLLLPSSELVQQLGLRWTGKAADYIDSEDRLAAFDPNAHEKGPTALLVREDLVRNFLHCQQLSLCWIMLGEKQIIGADFGGRRKYHPRMRMSGAYLLNEKGVTGFMKCTFEGKKDKVLKIIRS